MSDFFDKFSAKNLKSIVIRAEDIGLDERYVEFLKENYMNYSIRDLSELVEIPVQLLKSFLTSNNIAKYTLNDMYPDGYALCAYCKKILPYDQFYKNSTKKNKCQTYCKNCNNVAKAKRYQRQKEERERKGLPTTLTTKEKVNYIKENYEMMSVNEICIYTGLSESRIRQIAAQYNLKKYKPPKDSKFRKCCSCNRILPTSRFNVKSASSTGYSSRCKDCIAIYRRLRTLNKNIKLEEINKVCKNEINQENLKGDGTINIKKISLPKKELSEKEKMLQAIQNKYKNNTISKSELKKIKKENNSEYLKKIQSLYYECTVCHEKKLGTEFYYSKRAKRMETVCKKCKQVKNKESYLKRIKDGAQW